MSLEAVIALGDRRHLRVIISYTLLSLVASVIVGFILGIFRRLLSDGPEHEWGTWDYYLVLKLVATLVVCFALYWRLARRHPNRFLANGIAIAALTGALSFLGSLLSAPNVELLLLVVSVVSHIVIFLVVAMILRLFFRMPVKAEANAYGQ